MKDYIERKELLNIKEKLIKEIEENFDDIKDVLMQHNGAEEIPLFRDYTNEIIKIIEKEFQ